MEEWSSGILEGWFLKGSYTFTGSLFKPVAIERTIIPIFQHSNWNEASNL